jgi:hypothetical protein
MKITALLLALLPFALSAQQPFFEGELTYKISVRSRMEGLSDSLANRMFVAGETKTILCKNGNYKEHHVYVDYYTISNEKKQSIKFRNLDTLYVADFDMDTSQVLSVTKDAGSYRINGYDCKALTILTAANTRQYYYSPSLRMDTAFDKDNTIAKYNVYSRESGGAVYLMIKWENPVISETDSCTKVAPSRIDDKVYELPHLPMKKFDPNALVHTARFRGGDKAWMAYLQANLDTKLSLKYVKLPKGQKEATVKVMVEFAVAPDGSITEAQVLNEKEVHPKLAKEALRVINESPRWEPASFFGERMKGYTKQPILFIVQAE